MQKVLDSTESIDSSFAASFHGNLFEVKSDFVCLYVAVSVYSPLPMEQHGN